MIDIRGLLEEYIDTLPLGSDFYASVSDDGVIEIGYQGLYSEFGPKMYATSEIDEASGYCYLWPSISMPECNGQDLEYADSFMYLADVYADACKIATYMLKYPMIID